MIVILTQCFPSRVGGVESLISNLALGLSKKEKIIVFADTYDIFLDEIYDKKYQNQILVKRIGGIKFFRKKNKLKQIKLFIQSNNIKLIIADSWKSFELGIDFINNKKIPSICLAHGNELLSKNFNKQKRIINTLQKTSLIVANSIYTKNLAQDLKLKNTEVDYIYPGAEDFRHISTTKVPNIKGSPILLTLARIEKRKGHSLVIESVKKLIYRYPNINYIIAGDGPEVNNLIRLVAINKITKNVTFVGSINDGQKKYIFQKTDLMIMPTSDESEKNSIEGFGIAYIEAAFFCIPSIASNIGGTSEAVLNNSTGIVLKKNESLYDVILDLLENKDKRTKLGNTAQERAVRYFQWDKIAENHLSIYKKYNII